MGDLSVLFRRGEFLFFFLFLFLARDWPNILEAFLWLALAASV